MQAIRSLKQALRNMLLPRAFLREFESMRLTQGRLFSAVNAANPSRSIRDCEFRVFSQFGEDGIIQRLIQTVPITHRTFIEFGVEDFAESNCRFLLMNNNWRGFVLDSSERAVASMRSTSWYWKHDLRAACAMLTRDNINDQLRASGFPRDLGLLSIDVDGVDYWLFEAITAFEPRILIVEYNATFGDERAITVPYHPAFSRRAQHYSDMYYGASLAALAHLADQRGYALVGTESAGVNAFFVRRDVLGDWPALSVREAYSPCYVRQSRNREGVLDFLDPEGRRAAIAGLPVVNVLTGATEPL